MQHKNAFKIDMKSFETVLKLLRYSAKKLAKYKKVFFRQILKRFSKLKHNGQCPIDKKTDN